MVADSDACREAVVPASGGRRHPARGALVAAVVACVQLPLLAPVTSVPARAATSAESPAVSGVDPRAAGPGRNLAPYRGLGTWVDRYDTRLWARPRVTVRDMHAKGVRTVFLQTINSTSSRSVIRTGALDRFIETAHRLRMLVVAWYLPTFTHVRVDLAHSLAAIRYRTDEGQRFDGFGLDIESPVLERVSTRIRRLLWLSHRIRNTVGPSVSLGAIAPSPLGMKRRPTYWGRLRDFPFAELSRIYDVIAPMGYFTYRVEGKQWAYDYTAFNIAAVRNVSGDAHVPLHPVGGLAKDSSRGEVRGYVQALREGGVLGGSLYDFATTKRLHWPALGQIPIGR